MAKKVVDKTITPEDLETQNKKIAKSALKAKDQSLDEASAKKQDKKKKKNPADVNENESESQMEDKSSISPTPSVSSESSLSPESSVSTASAKSTESSADETSSPKKVKKHDGKSKVRGAKYSEARKALDKNKEYKTIDAIKELRNVKYTTFSESVELHITLGVDPKNTDHRVRFTTSLPYGTGKSVRVLAITDNKKENTSHVTYRGIDVVDEIVSGKLAPGKDFDIVITAPAHMKDMAKAAKILGPKGIMPNPKNGTVTNDIEKTIADLAKGQVEIKSQQGHAVLHALVGNLGFKDEEIAENVNYILSELNKNTPSKLKKKFIQKAYVATTMSPSLRIIV